MGGEDKIEMKIQQTREDREKYFICVFSFNVYFKCERKTGENWKEIFFNAIILFCNLS